MYIIIKVNLSNSKVMSRTNRDGSTLRNGKPRTYKSVYPSTQPSPATRNSPRETRNSGNQSTSSQPPSRATSGRKLPPNPIDLTGPTNEQQQQEENNNVLNTGTNNVNVQHNTEQTGNHSAEEGIDGAGNTVVPPTLTLTLMYSTTLNRQGTIVLRKGLMVQGTLLFPQTLTLTLTLTLQLYLASYTQSG